MRSIFRFVFPGYLILFGIPGSLCGQKTVERSLAASFGFSNFHILDEVASPLIFSHTGITPSLYYNARRAKSLQFAEASFYYNNLKTTQDNFTVENYCGHFRYAYLFTPFHLKLSENDLNISFGGSFSSFFNRSDYDFWNYYYSTTNRAITSWYWSHSVDLGFNAEYYLTGGASFSLHCYVPLISNVSRPTYSSSGDYNYTTNTRTIGTTGETMILSKNITFNSLIAFNKPLTEKLSLLLGYEFYLAQYSEPDDIALYMNNFRIGMSYIFIK
jgi:hypothetical protein